MRQAWSRHVSIASLALMALTISPVAPVQGGVAYAQVSGSSEALAAARALYQESRFEEALTQVRDALASRLITGRDVQPARELMARCLVRSGNRLEAKEAFKGVLRQFPGYRPDQATVPPDEREVFDLALREVTAEQIQAGDRVPASLGFTLGTGKGDNEDMAEIVVAGGGEDKFDNKSQFGGSVRFPLRSRTSIELELQRFRATNVDGNTPPNDTRFEVSALPLSISIYQAIFSGQRLRAYAFVGGGPLLTAISKIEFGDFGGSPLNVSGQKNGTYLHAGLEGEVLVLPKLSLSARVLGRSAKAKGVLDDFTFDAYGVATLKDREIDFSGISATIGLRAYIGY